MIKDFRTGFLKGKIIAPDSKSEFIRVLLGSLLVDGKTKIDYSSKFCDDVKNTIKIVTQIATDVIIEQNSIIINNKLKKIEKLEIHCGESALLFRSMSILASVFSENVIIKAKGSLINRVDLNEKLFQQLNLQIKKIDYNSYSIIGKINFSEVEIDCSNSSQYLTGLLLCSPILKNDITLNVQNIKSKYYIDLTLDVLSKFNINVQNLNYQNFIISGIQEFKEMEFKIGGCWSSASNFIVAAIINGDISIENLDENSLQPDKIIYDLLNKLKGNINFKNNKVKIKKSKIEAFEFDANDYPDLIPVLIILALNTNGISKIYGINRLIKKESNRLESLVEILNSLKIKIKVEEDCLVIQGGNYFIDKIFTRNDHRIAMAQIIASVKQCNIVNIDEINCINKSYPSFFDDILKLISD